MRRFMLALAMALLNPVNYGERPVKEQKVALYQVRQTLPKIERGKTLFSSNRMSQKSLRKRSKWG